MGSLKAAAQLVHDRTTSEEIRNLAMASVTVFRVQGLGFRVQGLGFRGGSSERV